MRLSIENNYFILRTKKAAYLWKPWIRPFRWSFKQIDEQLKKLSDIQLAVTKERCTSKHYLEDYTGPDMTEQGCWRARDDFRLPKPKLN